MKMITKLGDAHRRPHIAVWCGRNQRKARRPRADPRKKRLREMLFSPFAHRPVFPQTCVRPVVEEH